MTPEEIKDIRVSLGLTQVEAGELLGGGPRAFTKYEAGTVTPSASTIRLLRLLEADPSMISVLGGDSGRRPSSSVGVGPFEVDGEQISVLNAHLLMKLLRRLLVAEAQTHGLPVDGIQVAGNIYTPDGGEDGRIEWTGGPERTPVLPSRLCQFQLKSGPVSPSVAAQDVISTGGRVKGMVENALSAGGHYILICTAQFTQRQIQTRKKAILASIRKAGVDAEDEQVSFWDADQVASWTNFHPSVVAWIREITQSAIADPFRSWDHWSGRSEHDLHGLVDDERLPGLRGWLRDRLSTPRTVSRLVGLSGIGKTRLALEALGPSEDGMVDDSSMREIVLYAVESEASTEMIVEAAQRFADVGARVVVVVDDCSPDTHRKIAGIVTRANSHCSLLTIDYEIPTGTLGDDVYLVEKAPPEVIQGIIEQQLSLESEDKRRLERFSRGFPGMALRIANAWRSRLPVAQASDDHLVDAYVLGRTSRNDAALLKAASLVATSELVQVEPSPFQIIGDEEGRAVRLGELAEIDGLITTDELHAGVRELLERGVLQRRGGFAVLQPRPIALNLAGRQWRHWTPERWDHVLGEGASTTLKNLASRQLALLNTTDYAVQAVEHVCRPGGPFWGLEGLLQPGNARVISYLAEIDAVAASSAIESFLDEVEDLKRVEGDLRRSLVVALEKIAFREDTFEDGAGLLLRLAAAENEPWGNNATAQFRGLFPLFLAGTAADGDVRLRFLDDVSATDDPSQLDVVVEALSRGCLTNHYFRVGNAGSHGSRPNVDSWRPSGGMDARNYIGGCAARLSVFAQRGDALGEKARSNLGHQLRALVCDGFGDVAEAVVKEVSPAVNHWPEALEGLGDVVRYDADRIDSAEIDRVRELIHGLQPKDLESRIRLVVTEMSWDYPDDEDLDYETRQERQSAAVRELAQELAKEPETLRGYLDMLSRAQLRSGNGRRPQRRTFEFGSAVAGFFESPLNWLEPMALAAVNIPEHERDLGLLSGLVSRIAVDHPQYEVELKQLVAGTQGLAPAFPFMCLRMGIKESDIDLAIEALEGGRLQAGHLRCWALGGELAKVSPRSVAPLFDAMLSQSGDAYSAGLDLMHMYAYRDRELLDGLRPQILLAVERASCLQLGGGRPDAAHDFAEILSWFLVKGRDNEDARKVALELAKVLADPTGYEDEQFYAPLVPILLSGFPEIAWPILGQTILTDQLKGWLLRTMLRGNAFLEHSSSAPILSLPEDVLFAWCHANSDGAPAFAAEVVPILTSFVPNDPEPSLHPVMSRLIDEFGDRDDVWHAIGTNLNTFGWMGSTTSYYELFRGPFALLEDHPTRKVRTWAKRMLRGIDSSIKSARDHDDEWQARFEL